MRKKGIRVIAAAVLLTAAVCFTGCGKDKETDGTQTAAEETVTGQGGENQAAESAEDKSAGETGSVDITSLADQLFKEISYEDELSEMDLETAKMFLSFGDASVEEAKIYESTGATAEEIVVLKCSSEDDAKKAEAALKQRVEEQKEAFEDYVPKELTKLSDAVIVTKGDVAILSVSGSPDQAKSIINP